MDEHQRAEFQTAGVARRNENDIV